MTTLFAVCLDRNDIVIRKFSLSEAASNSIHWLFTNQRSVFFNQFDGEVHEYTGKYTPDSTELLYVSELEEIEALKKVSDSSAVDFDVIDSSSMHGYNIKALMIEVEGEFLIQRFTKSQYLSKKHTLVSRLFDDKSVFDKVSDDGVVLDDKLCAVIQNEKLLFHKEFYVRGFIGLTKIFREASNQEIESFFSSNLFDDLDVEEVSEKTNSINRKKIFSIIKSEQLQHENIIDRIKAAASDAQFELLWNDDKIIVPKNRTDLSTLLSILDDKIARGPISNKLLYINSSRILK